MPAQLIRHAVRPRAHRHDFRAPRVDRQELQDVPSSVQTVHLRGVDGFQNLVCFFLGEGGGRETIQFRERQRVMR